MLCIHWYPTLGSTNDEAIRLAREGAPAGTVVWVETQSAGRGQAGRRWVSAPGNLSFSVVLRPDLPAALAGRLGIAAGLSAARMLSRLTGLPVRTKWPNDLYLHGLKAGGLLLEARNAPGGALEWAVAGLGLNVASHPDVAPPGQPATSLSAHGWEGPPGILLEALADSVVQGCREAASEDGWAEICREWGTMDLTAGTIQARIGGNWVEATGNSLDTDGALIVETRDGHARLTSGDNTVRTVPVPLLTKER